MQLSLEQQKAWQEIALVFTNQRKQAFDPTQDALAAHLFNQFIKVEVASDYPSYLEKVMGMLESEIDLLTRSKLAVRALRYRRLS